MQLQTIELKSVSLLVFHDVPRSLSLSFLHTSVFKCFPMFTYIALISETCGHDSLPVVSHTLSLVIFCVKKST